MPRGERGGQQRGRDHHFVVPSFLWLFPTREESELDAKRGRSRVVLEGCGMMMVEGGFLCSRRDAN